VMRRVSQLGCHPSERRVRVPYEAPGLERRTQRGLQNHGIGFDSLLAREVHATRAWGNRGTASPAVHSGVSDGSGPFLARRRMRVQLPTPPLLPARQGDAPLR
jgi:hypothetical protein